MNEKTPQKREENPSAPDSDSASSNTFSERVQASASGLIRDAFLNSKGNDVASTLSDALAAGGKAGPSGQSASQSSGSENLQSSSTLTAGSSDSKSRSSRLESFRSSYGTQAELEFDPQFETGEPILRDEGGRGKEKATAVEHLPGGTMHLTSTFENAWNSSLGQAHASDPELSHDKDGAAIVAILSDPAFQPYPFPEEAPDEASDRPYTISAAEMALARDFESIMLRPSGIEGQSTADISSHPPTSTYKHPWSHPVKAATAPYTEESYYYLDTDRSFAQPTQQALVARMETFFDEIENYHEDVWGYLQPHVKAARKELEERQSQGESNLTDGPAVRRLGMILGHLEGSQRSSVTDSLSAMLTSSKITS